MYRTRTFMPVFTYAQHRRYPLSSSTHTHTHTHTHIHFTSKAYITAVANPSVRLSRRALVLLPSKIIKENGNLGRHCMEHVHVVISVKVIMWTSGRPPEAH